MVFSLEGLTCVYHRNERFEKDDPRFGSRDGYLEFSTRYEYDPGKEVYTDGPDLIEAAKQYCNAMTYISRDKNKVYTIKDYYDNCKIVKRSEMK